MATDYNDLASQQIINLQRVATQLLKTTVYPSLNEAYKAARLILAEYDEINFSDLNKISAAIRREVKSATAQPWSDVTEQFEQSGITAAAFTAAIINETANANLKIPAEQKIINYINRSLMSLSGPTKKAGVWAEFVQGQIDSNVNTYNNILKSGFSDGLTIAQIIKELKKATDGLLTNQAEALSRTGINHYANQANIAMALDNKNIVEREVPVVTFDSNISRICVGIGSKYGLRGWPIGESPVGYPPYHYNCRTVIQFLVKGQKNLGGTRSSVGGQSGKAAREAFEKRRDRTGKKPSRRGRIDDNIFKPGQIPANTIFDTFLKRQPRWFVEATLGKTGAKLFLDGKLSLSKFSDLQGRPLTIAELRTLNARAFDRAGI